MTTRLTAGLVQAGALAILAASFSLAVLPFSGRVAALSMGMGIVAAGLLATTHYLAHYDEPLYRRVTE